MEELRVKVGILTSGGDCQALNSAMYGLVKGLCNMSKEQVEIFGILEGYTGLIEGKYKKMKAEEFQDILNMGGTILGSSRQPFKWIQEPDDKGRDKVKSMIDNYKKMQLDCLVVLGGNGSHKTANLLSENGLNVITLPKTIDNDIHGTDMTFGYASAIDIAAKYIDDMRTTARSHKRIFVVEIMGNKAGWLTLNAGIASGCDVIIIPEIPYDVEKIVKFVNKKIENGKKEIIIAVAEGVKTKEESKLSKKELKAIREQSTATSSMRLENQLRGKVHGEVRSAVIGHIQRGGNPSAYDRILSSTLGVKAAELIVNKDYGKVAVLRNGKIKDVPLKEVAGKKKVVGNEDEITVQAKALGICFGDE